MNALVHVPSVPPGAAHAIASNLPSIGSLIQACLDPARQDSVDSHDGTVSCRAIAFKATLLGRAELLAVVQQDMFRYHSLMQAYTLPSNTLGYMLDFHVRDSP